MIKNKLPKDLPFFKGVSGLPQISIITRDTEKMARQLSEMLKLGSFKIFSAQSPQLFNATYDNKPEDWAMKAGLTWLGSTQIEIVEPTKGRTVYEDYLNSRNQKAGIEHIFFTTDNFETTLNDLEKVGYPLKQEAQLNAPGKLGIFPVPALPSFLKNLAARFGYTSTMKSLKIDIEVA
ncbi:MAG: VOC family protein, partial [Bacteroidota bacterium]